MKTPISNTAELYCLIVTLLHKDSTIVLDVSSFPSILKDYQDFPCSFSESDTRILDRYVQLVEKLHIYKWKYTTAIHVAIEEATPNLLDSEELRADISNKLRDINYTLCDISSVAKLSIGILSKVPGINLAIRK